MDYVHSRKGSCKVPGINRLLRWNIVSSSLFLELKHDIHHRYLEIDLIERKQFGE